MVKQKHLTPAEGPLALCLCSMGLEQRSQTPCKSAALCATKPHIQQTNETKDHKPT